MLTSRVRISVVYHYYSTKLVLEFLGLPASKCHPSHHTSYSNLQANARDNSPAMNLAILTFTTSEVYNKLLRMKQHWNGDWLEYEDLDGISLCIIMVI
jgi:hypothetical protein